MALLHLSSSYLDDDNNKDVLQLLAEREERLAAKKKAVAELKYEETLIEQDAFLTYKQYVHYSYFPKELLQQTHTWIQMLHNTETKIDKRRKYEEKSSYDYIVTKLKEFLGVDESVLLVITSVCDYNYGQATELDFDVEGRSWSLKIPNVPNVCITAYRDYGADCFRLVLCRYKKSASGFVGVRSFKGATFEETNLKQIYEKAKSEED